MVPTVKFDTEDVLAAAAIDCCGTADGQRDPVVPRSTEHIPDLSAVNLVVPGTEIDT